MSESCVCDVSVEFALIRGHNHTHPEDTADGTNLIKHVCEIRIKCCLYNSFGQFIFTDRFLDARSDFSVCLLSK